MLSLDFDIGPLLARIEGIEKSAKEAVRPAAFAASDAYYNEVKARALSIGGSKRLQASIYQKFVVNSASGALGDTATYHISWRQGRSTNNKKGQSGEGALPSTTFGHWIEFGRWQRYMTVTDKNGEWVTVARPEMAGKPKPKRGASQAEKDAYWMPRKGGPVFHGPKSFLRSGYDAKKTEAMQKAKDRMFQLVKESIK